MRVSLILLLFIASVNCNSKKPDGSEHKRVPQKEVAGLLMPATLEPFEVRDEFLANGDGILLHRYRVSEETYNEIQSQLPNGGESLPFADDVYVDNYIYEFVEANDNGLYAIKNLDKDDRRDVVLFVLNRTKMELIILLSKS